MKKRPYFSSLLMIVIILLVANIFEVRRVPDPPSDQGAVIEFRPIMREMRRPGWQVMGAWSLSSEDPRLSGLSGLERMGSELAGVVDDGRIVFLPSTPNVPAHWPFRVLTLRDLNGKSLAGQDSEAIGADLEGFWVAFEMRHRIIFFPRLADLGNPQYTPPRDRWPKNNGIEAIVPAGEGLPPLFLSEGGHDGIYVEAGELITFYVAGARGAVTGAARLGDGRIVILTRELEWTGFRAWIAQAEWKDEQLEIGEAVRLPTGPRTNLEGVAVTAGPHNRDRLHFVSDNNGVAYLGQELLVIDVDRSAWPD